MSIWLRRWVFFGILDVCQEAIKECLYVVLRSIFFYVIQRQIFYLIQLIWVHHKAVSWDLCFFFFLLFVDESHIIYLQENFYFCMPMICMYIVVSSNCKFDVLKKYNTVLSEFEK